MVTERAFLARAAWILASGVLCLGGPFAVAETAAVVGLDAETIALVVIGLILGSVTTGTWILLGRTSIDADTSPSKGGLDSLLEVWCGGASTAGWRRGVLPWLCPTVIALWAFVIVTDRAVVPYSSILVPLAAALIVCGPITTVVVGADIGADVRRGSLVGSVLRLPDRLLWRSLCSIAVRLASTAVRLAGTAVRLAGTGS